MKTYNGIRTIDGLQVTVNGAPLDDGRHVRCYSDAGIEWGYKGDAPRQLALALLLDHLGDEGKAEKGADEFMAKVVAVLDNEWTLTSAEIDEALTGT